MPEYTPSSEDRNHRNALLLGGVVALLVAWAIAHGPDRAQAPAFYYPEPPAIMNSYNDSSTNVCIGYCPDGAR